MDEILKDRYGHKIGTIKEVGNKLYIYDEHGHKAGYYDPNTNKTYDEHGHFVGTGNLLTSLI